MGTRNLVIVVQGGRHRIAQYGQWDGQPGGQGLTVLRFCDLRLRAEHDRARFVEALGRCRFGEEWELKGRTNSSGWEHREPQLSRDMAAGVLEFVLASTEEVLLSDSVEFARDSLFCEWAYVIDLDQMLLEVHKGFNKLALDPAVDRFALREPGVDPYATNAVAAAGAAANEYQPIRLLTSWSLDDLPLEDEFLLAGEEPDEPDDECPTSRPL